MHNKETYFVRTQENGERIEYVQMADDREVSVKVSCNLFNSAATLIYESDSPGGRFGPLPHDPILRQLGVRVITYDRPGYGESDRRKGRTAASAAEDVEQIADALGVEQFGIFGSSGGVPHALGSAALLGDRVTSVVGLVGRMGFDSLKRATSSSVTQHMPTRHDFSAIEKEYESYLSEVKKNPAWFIDTFLKEQITESDRLVLGNVGVRGRLLEPYCKALVQISERKGGGWADDIRAFSAPWGYDLGDVSQPVLLWHGEKGASASVLHSQWIADQIPQAYLKVMPNGGHLDAIPVMIPSMAWQRNVALGIE